MGAYLLRRLLLVIPTLFGIITINFAVVQFAPGGPVEQMLAQLRGETQTLGRITGGGSEVAQPTNSSSGYRGRRGLDPQTVAQITHMFGFDKPPLTRYWEMIGNVPTVRFRPVVLSRRHGGASGAGPEAAR